MIEITNDKTASMAFQAQVEGLRLASLRDELDFEQIPAPGGLAQDSIAFAVNVKPEERGRGGDLGTGRFVFLYEPTAPEQWQSNFRIVTFMKSPLETDIGAEAEASDVAWSWLLDALSLRGAEYSNIAGTTTRVISTGHGSMQGQNQHAELEMRASWSPIGSLSSHLEAWQDLVCVMSGLSISPEATRLLPRR